MINCNLNTLFNKMGLKTEYCIDSYDREKRAKTAGERFVQVGKMLSESNVIGLRFSSLSSPNRQFMAFSSGGIRVSEEDYQWIFEKCAKTDPKRKENRACEMKARYFLHCHHDILSIQIFHIRFIRFVHKNSYFLRNHGSTSLIFVFFN